MLQSTMNESMDIAFLLATMKPMNFLLSAVRHTVLSIINPLIENNCDIRLALVEFRPSDDSSVPIVHSFTRSIVTFKQWFTTSHGSVEQHTQDEAIAIHDVLQEALNLEWRITDNDRCHENIVFLITDGFPCRNLVNPTETQNDDCPCACDDLWTMSNQFVNRNLTLVIVGISPIADICDSLYGAIAKNTGGEYIPLTNANHVLFLSIQSIIKQGYTLSQSFRHIKQEEFEKNSSYHHSNIQKQDQSEIKHCQIMAQKGAWLLDHFYHVNSYR
ncbi:unnamed protein product [Rotaria sp. Silwood1]|nr:unnamed protein product [Rotaria sp. Silwood1]CAF3364997.1 unnamed protein product [Rotaria sp. Silwood1]CAF3380687.1 unnamed protein product [Rotaria sp. Silwood1]CAF4746189.1 unnamed protein product [Rotaria sp. Silwood1]CAF4775820.1 unnamed protein product [Rotaria sp. Silwood1]